MPLDPFVFWRLSLQLWLAALDAPRRTLPPDVIDLADARRRLRPVVRGGRL